MQILPFLSVSRNMLPSLAVPDILNFPELAPHKQVGRSFLFNDRPAAAAAMGHAVACGLSLNELCQITFTPRLTCSEFFDCTTS